MRKQTIEVVISPTGEISIEAIGYKGSSCQQATEFLEKALGVCSTRQRKPEYLQNTRVASTQKISS
jgi:hypothetical protein